MQDVAFLEGPASSFPGEALAATMLKLESSSGAGEVQEAQLIKESSMSPLQVQVNGLVVQPR